MSNAPAVLTPIESLDRRLSIETIEARRTAIRQLMKKVMQKDIDYGTIPGTPKPTLYKAGAEKLCALFQIAPRVHVQDLSTPDTIRYQVKVELYSTSGIFAGEGIGAASSAETKYQWRASVCREEFDLTPEDRRRVVYKKTKEGFYTILQVRTAPEDVENTILKMAKKRALIDAVLTVTAASDIFSQDIEEGQDDDEDDENGDEGNQPPAQKPGTQAQPPAAKGYPNEGQAKRFYAIGLREGKRSDDQLKAYLFARFEVQNARHLKTRNDYEEACKWAADPKAPIPQAKPAATAEPAQREPGDDSQEQLEPQEGGIPFQERF